METRTGNVSINSENMLPIIKKWLYSDKDIFVREVISNGCDAISKLHKLEMMGEYQYPDKFKDSIRILVNPDKKTVKFIDTGLGMTAEEVEKYITQIAFSGATAFFEKYKDKANKDDIIGHFGLGFYSVFMVSDMVTIDTLSYQKDAKPVHWECDGGDTYTIGDGDYSQVGTCVTLHLNEDNLEFANEYRMREVLERYCSFMPVEIFLSKEGAPQEYEEVKPDEVKEDDVVVGPVHHDAVTREEDDGKGGKKTVEVEPAKDMVKINKRPVSISDIHPLWQKTPSQCTDDEYKDFYRKVFNDYREPLFWIHLNMDYPFNMKGILYFPKINTEYESIEGTIKLYSNQVFVADNVKEIVPEYMVALKGVVDCPDFPLNVSRSALQNDGFVKKMSDYIAKKVADKLVGMCKTKREDFEKYWDDINPFLKYGCLKDEKFDEHIKDFRIEKVPHDGETKEDTYKINALHKMVDSDDMAEIPLGIESAGTLKMFALYPELQEVLEKGSVFFIDELNARLHPLLVRNFLLTFLNPEINTNHAQLVFTTHDTWQLSNQLLRRDEIWFVEKDEKGISTLYSLADFVDEDGSRIRKDESYEKNYLIGKYGAIPTLKSIDIFKED